MEVEEWLITVETGEAWENEMDGERGGEVRQTPRGEKGDWSRRRKE